MINMNYRLHEKICGLFLLHLYLAMGRLIEKVEWSCILQDIEWKKVEIWFFRELSFKKCEVMLFFLELLLKNGDTWLIKDCSKIRNKFFRKATDFYSYYLKYCSRMYHEAITFFNS